MLLPLPPPLPALPQTMSLLLTRDAKVVLNLLQRQRLSRRRKRVGLSPSPSPKKRHLLLLLHLHLHRRKTTKPLTLLLLLLLSLRQPLVFLPPRFPRLLLRRSRVSNQPLWSKSHSLSKRTLLKPTLLPRMNRPRIPPL